MQFDVLENDLHSKSLLIIAMQNFRITKFAGLTLRIGHFVLKFCIELTGVCNKNLYEI